MTVKFLVRKCFHSGLQSFKIHTFSRKKIILIFKGKELIFSKAMLLLFIKASLSIYVYVIYANIIMKYIEQQGNLS